jgi:poly(3-hydroxybutyrate) depolymerase
MYPGYTGYRPRLQLWHGTADATINYENQTEAIKEWTNVLGLSATPTTNTTETINGNAYNVETWNASCGFTVLEAYTEPDGGHTTPIDPSVVISFFGLDKPNGQDPEVAACGGKSGCSISLLDRGLAASGTMLAAALLGIVVRRRRRRA